MIMEKDNKARTASLSKASMLAAVGVTMMFGIGVFLQVLGVGGGAGIVMLYGFIFWLLGLYYVSAAYKGANSSASERFGKIFKLQLYLVVAVIAFIALVALVAATMNGSSSETFAKFLVILLFGFTIYVAFGCRNEAQLLKEYGLKSMGLVFNGFTILLIVQAVFAIVTMVILCSDRMPYMPDFSDMFDLRYRYGTPIGIVFLMLLAAIAWFVAAAFMIAGWWGVRSELPALLENAPAEDEEDTPQVSEF